MTIFGKYLKRDLQWTSGVVDITSQIIVNKGDYSKINIVSTASSIAIGNPFLSTIPGTLVNISLTSVSTNNIFSNPSEGNVYKSILVNSLGNAIGEKAGSVYEKSFFGGQFSGEVISSAAAG